MPICSYHVYGKQKDTVLTGSDASGSWNDPVSYWMPFLNNQYGTYGFHDATSGGRTASSVTSALIPPMPRMAASNCRWLQRPGSTTGSVERP